MMNSKNIRKSPSNKKQESSTAVSENIRVIVRVRPPNKRELLYVNHRNVINVVNDQTLIFDPTEEEEPFFYHGVRQKHRDIGKLINKNVNFTFDKVFGYESTNENIFQTTTKDLFNTLMNGYNCSIFAYGATGAGKTHTMLGCKDDYGITFLTLSELFSFRDRLVAECTFKIDVSYLEVYNETIKDLLHPGRPLNLCETKEYGVVVNNLSVFKVTELEEVINWLVKGNCNRTQHATDANAESSRSHAVFQVYINMTMKNTDKKKIAKLSMIDLAGSEKGASTGFSGERFTEGTNINKSLLALSNCINSLAAGKKYICYRDSKLTRLLKDSLGGNCKTVMLANVSPSSLNYEDTYNTLKYAMRATKIKLNLQKSTIANGGSAGKNINYYVQLIKDLKKENEKLKKQLLQSSHKPDRYENIENQELNHNLEDLFANKQQLIEKLTELERSELFLIMKEQLKEDSKRLLSMPNHEVANITTQNFKERDRRVNELREQLTILEESNTHIEVKLQELLQTAPSLHEKAEKRNLQIEYKSATTMNKYLKKVCDLQAEDLELRMQFSNLLKTPLTKSKESGFLSQQLSINHKQLIKKIGRISSSSSSKSIESTPKQGSKIKYNKLENSPLNSTFVVSSGSRTSQLTALNTPTTKKQISFPKNVLQPTSKTNLGGKVLKSSTRRLLKINCASSNLDSSKLNKNETYRKLTTPNRVSLIPKNKTPTSNSSLGRKSSNQF